MLTYEQGLNIIYNSRLKDIRSTKLLQHCSCDIHDTTLLDASTHTNFIPFP
jgi:hypothetical protein